VITAGTVNLDAVTGIGNSTALNLAAAAISADTTNGNIHLNNSVAATVSSLTTGTGTIQFDQTGAAVSFTTVTTVDGGVNLKVVGGNLAVGTAVTAGVRITTST